MSDLSEKSQQIVRAAVLGEWGGRVALSKYLARLEAVAAAARWHQCNSTCRLVKVDAQQKWQCEMFVALAALDAEGE